MQTQRKLIAFNKKNLQNGVVTRNQRETSQRKRTASDLVWTAQFDRHRCGRRLFGDVSDSCTCSWFVSYSDSRSIVSKSISRNRISEWLFEIPKFHAVVRTREIDVSIELSAFRMCANRLKKRTSSTRWSWMGGLTRQWFLRGHERNAKKNGRQKKTTKAFEPVLRCRPIRVGGKF